MSSKTKSGDNLRADLLDTSKPPKATNEKIFYERLAFPGSLTNEQEFIGLKEHFSIQISLL